MSLHIFQEWQTFGFVMGPRAAGYLVIPLPDLLHPAGEVIRRHHIPDIPGTVHHIRLFNNHLMVSIYASTAKIETHSETSKSKVIMISGAPEPGQSVVSRKVPMGFSEN